MELHVHMVLLESNESHAMIHFGEGQWIPVFYQKENVKAYCRGITLLCVSITDE